MSNSIKASIVVPCYNEENRLPRTYWDQLIKADSRIDWVFVNDGSKDGTNDILSKLCENHNANLISYKVNLGKGNAVRLGLLHAIKSGTNPEYVGYLDSDGAFPISDVLNMIQHVKDISGKNETNPFDSIILARVALSGRSIRRKLTRHYIGRVVATIVTMNWRDAPYDTQSGFKLFQNSSSLRSSLEKDFLTRWFFDVELLTRIGINKRGALHIWEEPATSWIDVAGSNLSYRDFGSIIIELIQTRRQVRQFLKILG